MAVKCWGTFIVFQFALAMHQQKNCWRFSRSDCISCRQWLWHASAFCQQLWFGFLTVGTTYSTNIILFTYNGRNRRQYFSQWSPCFGSFESPCYNRRTHNSMVEKPGDQNITACENQGKQCELSGHWKHKKTLFFSFK